MKKRDNILAIAAKQFQSQNEQLIIRDAVRGGKTDAVLDLWNSEEMLNTVAKFFDLNSLYTYAATRFAMPVGKPIKYDRIMGKLSDICVGTDNHIYCNGIKLRGIANVKVWIPPKT